MKIAVIGAGFGGMAAAFDLRLHGHAVTILESADYVGGLASGFREPYWEWSVEKFYHHWFQSDKHMLGLIRELGWQDKVYFPRPYTVLLHDGKWYPFDSIPKALLFPGLGFGLDKIRFGFVGLFLRLTNNWKALEGYTADEWMTAGLAAMYMRKMWKPLLIGKFGPYCRDVNMADVGAQGPSTRLGTFEGGFQAFADMFAGRLREMEVDFRLKTAVNSIQPEVSGRLIVDAGRKEAYDRVLVTTSPTLLARLCADLPEDYLGGLLQLKSMGAVVMVLSLHRQLSGRVTTGSTFRRMRYPFRRWSTEFHFAGQIQR
jgi:protoporphyrinogen oxidase